MSALGFYLFARWTKGKEAFPDLTENKNWYGFNVYSYRFDLILLRAGNTASPMAYATQYQAVKKAYKELGIRSKKVTHANRAKGAQRAEQHG
jgi:hypothetical protein